MRAGDRDIPGGPGRIGRAAPLWGAGRETPERTTGEREETALRTIGIRWRILAVLALPALVLAIAAGAVSTASVVDSRRAAELEELGSATGQLSLVAFLMAVALSVATIAVAWLFYRPLIGGTLLVVFVALIVLVVMKLKKARAAA